MSADHLSVQGNGAVFIDTFKFHEYGFILPFLRSVKNLLVGIYTTGEIPVTAVTYFCPPRFRNLCIVGQCNSFSVAYPAAIKGLFLHIASTFLKKNLAAAEYRRKKREIEEVSQIRYLPSFSFIALRISSVMGYFRRISKEIKPRIAGSRPIMKTKPVSILGIWDSSPKNISVAESTL